MSAVVTVLAKDFAAGLAAVWPAMATDESRPILSTVCFEPAGEAALRLVAADPYRIAMYDLRLSGGSEPLGQRAILRRGDVKILRSILASLRSVVMLSVVGDRIRIDWIYGAVEFRLVEGTYPDYAQILRAATPPAVSLNPQYLAESAAAFGKAPTIVEMQIDGSLMPVVLRSKEHPLTVIVMPVRTE
jgi:DNA polymerase III sliding clamp (beta) subunit (PCNA family)